MPAIVAIAIIVDSSLTLASEWRRILGDYFVPMLHRITDMHVGSQLRLGFVSYGPADSPASPLLANRFFTSPPSMTKELRDEPAKLGMGHTGSGGSLGLAALEGYAAAIEMFDLLQNDAEVKLVRPLSAASQPAEPDKTSFTFFLWHFAAALPDTATRPLWNSSPSLDDLSWSTIPEEISKRKIHCSMILIRPCPKFTEIFSSMSQGSRVTPWFTTRPHHTVLLSGFPAPRPKTVSTVPVKRPSETTTADRSPGPKRARVAASQTTSPAVASAKSAPQPSPPIPAAAAAVHAPDHQPEPPKPEPPNPPPISPPPPEPELPHVPIEPVQAVPKPAGGPLTMHQLADRMRAIEMTVINLKNAIIAANQAGNQEEVARLSHQLKEKASIFQRGKAMMQKLAMDHQNQNGGMGGGAASGLPHNSPPGPAQSSLGLGLTMGMVSDPSFPHMTQNRPGNNLMPTLPGGGPPQNATGIPPVPPNIANYPTAMAAQMKKLLDQRGGAKLPLSGTVANGGSNDGMNGTRPPSQTQSSSTSSVSGMGPTSNNGGLSNQDGQSQVSKKTSPPQWHGTLSWTGVDAHLQEKKEVRAQVVATGTHGNLQAETWPQVLLLTPSRELAVSLKEFEEWLRKHRPALCQLEAAGGMNSTHYNQLIHLLKDKNIYAIASWDIPGKGRTANMLICPFGDSGLLAAVFPSTGIPDMPKSKTVNLSLTSIISQFPEHIRKLPVEQRNAMIMQVLHRRQQSMQQPPNLAMANQHMQLASQQQQLQQQQQQQAHSQLQQQQQQQNQFDQLQLLQHQAQQQQQQEQQQANALKLNVAPGELNPFLPGSQANPITAGFLGLNSQGGNSSLMQQQQQQQQAQQQREQSMLTMMRSSMNGGMNGGMNSGISAGGLGGMGGGLTNGGMMNGAGGLMGVTGGGAGNGGMIAGNGGMNPGNGGMNPGQAGGGVSGVTYEMLQQWMARSDGSGQGVRQG